MNDFSYDIKQNIAVLSTKGNWALELNLVSWGNRTPTLDLRRWNEDHTKMSKGLSLTKDELEAIAKFVNEGGVA